MLGLEPALADAKGKTVLDLGCAEGLIGYQFLKAGAADVLGLDGLEAHIAVGRKHCPGVRFKVRDLNVQKPPSAASFDIVLALAILHKLSDPARGARYCTHSARSLVVIRLPIGSVGVIEGKHTKVGCNLLEVMTAERFCLTDTRQGPRGELVQYWRRA